MTGVLAGLINDYLPNRGNFDSWAADPTGGGHLNLANLNLIQKRNHILKTAIDSLEPKSRELLSILALLSEAVDYPTLSALNPHLPPEPEEFEIPLDPEKSWRWRRMSDAEKEEAQKSYQAALQAREEYEQAVQTRQRSPEFLAAPGKLSDTVRDLEHRGLLQYDRLTRRHDLHPVVRAIAVGDLKSEETDSYGRRVVDFFSRQTNRAYEEAETLEDVRNGIHIVRTLIKMGRYEEAMRAYRDDLAQALSFNLEANDQILSLLQPLYKQQSGPSSTLTDHVVADLAAHMGFALARIGETQEALFAHGSALKIDLRNALWVAVGIDLRNISYMLNSAQAEFCLRRSLDLALVTSNAQELFRTRLDLFRQSVRDGRWADAQSFWDLLDPMGRDWDRSVYRPGDAEFCYAVYFFEQGSMTEEHLVLAEKLATIGKNRGCVRDLYRLRGMWQLEQCQWSLAEESLSEAVSMARAASRHDAASETMLALARFQLGRLADAPSEAQRLANLKHLDHLALGELWLAMGDAEMAKKHGIEAYKEAWADGEPYVYRYKLNESRALLEKLRVAIPVLPPYDASKREKFPWEDELAAAIDKLRAEKEAEEAKKKAKKMDSKDVGQ